MAGAGAMGQGLGGAEEDRTPDLRIANATLSQLSYRPKTNYIIPPNAESLRLLIRRGARRKIPQHVKLAAPLGILF